MSEQYNNDSLESIAVIGMSCRFPGAENIEKYWDNLLNGRESVSFLSRENALKAGADPVDLNMKNYVTAGALIDKIEMFDADLFGFSRREAEILDPQQRLFLECAWEALELAGYCNSKNEILTGVFTSSSLGTYLLYNLINNREICKTFGHNMLELYNSKDTMPSRLAYALNLKGPCVAIQNGCTSSLAAVHFAVQNLLSYQCDMAIAGSSSIRLYLKSGYLSQEGGVLSPDGHCRPFDEKAQGTVGGNGVGVVVLKRIQEAKADGDPIFALIKGTALNNDGSDKIGFTAPGFSGQLEAIRNAYLFSGVDPGSISFVEAQGTGTPMGDSIEIEALKAVFNEYTDRKSFCALGSVKANIGHLDVTSGLAGMIKAILCLKNNTIPPQINFQKPNPDLKINSTPFFINTKAVHISSEDRPIRAAVNNFGLGGSNVHIILEQAPANPQSSVETQVAFIVPLSAKTHFSLKQSVKNLREYIVKNSSEKLADIAYTMQLGREAMNLRIAFLVHDGQELLRQLEKAVMNDVSGKQAKFNLPVFFLFSDKSFMMANEALTLCNTLPLFKKNLLMCDAAVSDLLHCTALELLQSNRPEDFELVSFIFQYALAGFLSEIGVIPQLVTGYGMGEYLAACLAGLIDLGKVLQILVWYGKIKTGTAEINLPYRIKSILACIDIKNSKLPYYSPEIGLLNDQNFSIWISGMYTRTINHESRKTTAVFPSDRIPDIIIHFDSVNNDYKPTDDGLQANQTDHLFLLQKNKEVSWTLLDVISELWMAGVEINWKKFNENYKGRRIPLPTYPFDQKRYWINIPLKPSTSANNSFFDTVRAKQSQTINHLVAILQNLIGCEQLDLNSTIKGLGVSSFIGIHFLVAVQQAFGVDLPIEVIYTEITIREIYALIERNLKKNNNYKNKGIVEKAKNSYKLVTLEILKAGFNPFFFIAPLNGVFLDYNRARFMSLAEGLKENTGFYCLNSPLLGSISPDADDIFLRAGECSELIINTTPRDSYTLGGWCNGGLLAFEVARQLLERGKRVDVLILFDTYELSFLSSLKRLEPDEYGIDRFDEILFVQSFLIEVDPKNMMHREQRIIAELDNLDETQWPDYLCKKLMHVPGMDEDTIKRMFSKYNKLYKDASKKSLNFINDYKAEEYHGKAVLFKAAGTGNRNSLSNLGWDKIFKGEFIVHELKGNHLSMLMEPLVNETAGLLNKYLK